MSYTYVDPFTTFRESLKGATENISEGLEERGKRKRVEAILGTLSPEEQQLFAGYTDPDELNTARMNYLNTSSDNTRADAADAYGKERDLLKDKEDAYQNELSEITKLDELNALGEDDIAERLNNIYTRYNKPYQFQANPEYNPKDRKSRKYLLQGMTKAEKGLEIKNKEEDYKQGNRDKNINTKFKNTKEIKAIENTNALKKVGIEAGNAKVLKQTPTYEDLQLEKPDAKEAEQRGLIEEINNRLKKRYGY